MPVPSEGEILKKSFKKKINVNVFKFFDLKGRLNYQNHLLGYASVCVELQYFTKITLLLCCYSKLLFEICFACSSSLMLWLKSVLRNTSQQSDFKACSFFYVYKKCVYQILHLYQYDRFIVVFVMFKVFCATIVITGKIHKVYESYLQT